MNARWEKGSIDDMGNLSDRIKQVREQARLSQEKFAEVLGEVDGIKVTRGAVGNWERGGGISRANLAAISRKFDVDLNWLERGARLYRRRCPQNRDGWQPLEIVTFALFPHFVKIIESFAFIPLAWN